MFKLQYLVLILLIALIGFFLSLKGWLSPVRNLTLSAISPFTMGIDNSVGSVRDFFKSILDVKNLAIENKKLNDDKLNFQSQLSHLQDVQRENQILKEELGFAKKQNLQLVPSQIINRTSYSSSSVLTINRGEIDGVYDGCAVLSSGFLVGQVMNASKTYADILIVADVNSKIPVVLSRSRGTGILHGGLEGLIIDDIPLDAPVEKDEDVLTSGLGGQLPAGLPVGKVTDILPSKGEIFKKVKVETALSFSRLEIVFVVKK
ncbi:MAG: rod shape-determining protein MreC [Candidatus Nealsonbacteria bacterium CG23_combo_of_CG06-09_8_20_14_all_40_13]|uniref:Cell shape-determining protein MreC n=1 Tax=Candidatus Nealsonbacteria bacterium CG23_combo_of_CG06-09_8_20_14_all_40_13 TaxID=1974724 RepID=A0A2G9YSQ9_9BACT|nr:MAG: rod shape-determining protein MreC [Candidatus Nealsonbacteria bacterium CG23_combo_of_CG06-09_8_20_14_all_40_13]PIR70962.1 MAG: rod shape-determining protein MreC [Candidatus Nealsonbacteria bacterium CG10_big_fil_rev_8_21_14_0_10_40_24]PIU43294.1 MAG: rod shape-determining protein MreC [Candidatus Nealsonbacteria bacterium CG07_land_8_20_14_0_80_40_10]